ncbi:hypothetical protein SAMN05421810_110150 [Amycolatopsis arida]|uniref:Asp23 family, cell envelope-related function n=1 Tax=Amycolatopsis arida TaxID=587909 RepID=A0A1I5ZUY5_9PSEU|nr:hypothetical protein [Amycolatopsis arida]TDX89383.1 hypothetical protein CLV69_110151 [Amycolatopsis arida]SFQ60222.1 hypothetical protein SAMN05421810_110150 [Amycolatopsis arida]
MSTGAGPDPRDDPRWELVRAAARVPVPTPPGLIARVLRSVHGVRGRMTAVPLRIPQDGGLLTVSERAVVLLARRLGAELGRALGGVHVSAVAMEQGVLEVLLTVRYGVAAGEAAERLRVRLHEALAAQLGGAAPPVNVHIADVHPT